MESREGWREGRGELARSSASKTTLALDFISERFLIFQAIVAEQVKPLLAVIAHIDVVIRNIFNVATKKYPRFIVATNILWVFITITCRPALATIVVALIDNQHHRLIVAADSLVVTSVSGKRNDRTHECKIFETSDCGFALKGNRGLYGTPDVPAFDVPSLAEQACKQPGDLHQRADAFLDIAAKPVGRMLKFLYRYPEVYADKIRRDFLDVLFVGVNDGRLAFFIRGFRAASDGSISEYRGKPKYSQRTPYTIGGTDEGTKAIDDYMIANKDWDKGDLAVVAKQFVEKAIQADPDNIGPPVSVLEIDQEVMRPDRFSARWIGDPGACKTDSQKKSANPN